MDSLKQLDRDRLKSRLFEKVQPLFEIMGAHVAGIAQPFYLIEEPVFIRLFGYNTIYDDTPSLRFKNTNYLIKKSRYRREVVRCYAAGQE
ncbi:unnamed protein product [marine sediment metagenome]|uniref:Uncharacterized protein n=1 Tax=marine sediment metagenome TaxID=412755 RepID=X1DKK8_9ZZZZ